MGTGQKVAIPVIASVILGLIGFSQNAFAASIVIDNFDEGSQSLVVSGTGTGSVDIDILSGLSGVYV